MYFFLQNKKNFITNFHHQTSDPDETSINNNCCIVFIYY